MVSVTFTPAADVSREDVTREPTPLPNLDNARRSPVFITESTSKFPAGTQHQGFQCLHHTFREGKRTLLCWLLQRRKRHNGNMLFRGATPGRMDTKTTVFASWRAGQTDTDYPEGMSLLQDVWPASCFQCWSRPWFRRDETFALPPLHCLSQPLIIASQVTCQDVTLHPPPGNCHPPLTLLPPVTCPYSRYCPHWCHPSSNMSFSEDVENCSRVGETVDWAHPGSHTWCGFSLCFCKSVQQKTGPCPEVFAGRWSSRRQVCNYSPFSWRLPPTLKRAPSELNVNQIRQREDSCFSLTASDDPEPWQVWTEKRAQELLSRTDS